MQTYFPKYFTQRAIGSYIALLLVVSLVFMRFSMEWYFMLFGLVEVLGFFYYTNTLTRRWSALRERTFTRTLLWSAFTIRAVWVIFSYFFYTRMTGSPFEFSAGDAQFYHEAALYGAQYLRDHFMDLPGYIPLVHKVFGTAFSDSGYATYLGLVYYMSGDSIIVSRLLKALYGALSCVLMYRLARRNFGEWVGRMTAVMCMLMPNLIYYCGLQLKEAEMVFLTVLFLERADHLMKAGQFAIVPTLVVVTVGMLLFTFRTVLAGVLFIAFFMALIMSSTRVVKWGRRALVIVLSLLFLGLMFSSRIEEEITELTSTDVISQQQGNMQWRSQRGASEGRSNRYIRYASAFVFAPMIFTIPFPTMVDVPGQENQQLLHGGNFVKNITSFFTILALFLLLMPYDWRKNLLQGEWRGHVLPIAFLMGYLAVLTVSSFAHSERFHLPSVPVALMLAAYAVERFNVKWRWIYTGWVILMFVAGVAWTWFKLSGRGWV